MIIRGFFLLFFAFFGMPALAPAETLDGGIYTDLIGMLGRAVLVFTELWACR